MPSDQLSLAGKVAIVTGSGRSNGIGAAIALAFARQGANVNPLLSALLLELKNVALMNSKLQVVIHYVSDSSAETAESVVQEIKALGTKAIAVQANMMDVNTGKTLVSAALKEFNVKYVDILGMNTI
jgi:NAD(P)-dependent dehydrogenase (short-subunit alcohol dehydrogenase family)